MTKQIFEIIIGLEIRNQERSDTMPKISLEAIRINSNMTQKEWAKALGVSPATVFNWEKGYSEPSLSQVRKMSNISGVPMDFIFSYNKSDTE